MSPFATLTHTLPVSLGENDIMFLIFEALKNK